MDASNDRATDDVDPGSKATGDQHGTHSAEEAPTGAAVQVQQTPTQQSSQALAPQNQSRVLHDASHPWRLLKASSTFDVRDMCLADVYSLARALANSTIVPRDLMNQPDNVFAVLLKGAELGLSVMTAVAEVQVIKGKVSLSSHLVNALVQRSKVMSVWKLVHSDDTKAVWRVQRHEWESPIDVEYTFAEAQKLKLDYVGPNSRGDSPWNTQRANMLRRRVITRAAREHAPDVVIAYDHGELEEGNVEVERADTAPVWSAPPPAAPRAPAEARIEMPSGETIATDFGGPRLLDDDVNFGESAVKQAERALAEFEVALAKAKTRSEATQCQSILVSWFERGKTDKAIAEVVARGEAAFQRRYRSLPK